MIVRPPLYYYDPLFASYEEYCEELRREEERLTEEERETLRKEVEAIEAAPLDPLWRNGDLSEQSLKDHGASGVALATYRLHFTLSNEDLV